MKRAIKAIVKHSEVSEKAIERYLVERVESLGGICLKYVNFSYSGYPDRIVMLPGGWTAWVELKSRGRKPTFLQTLRHEALRAVGQWVYVADSRERVDEIIDDWKSERDEI